MLYSPFPSVSRQNSNLGGEVEICSNNPKAGWSTTATSMKTYTATDPKEHIVVIGYGGGTNSRSAILTVNGTKKNPTNTITSTAQYSASISSIWDLNLTKGDIVTVTTNGQNSSQFCMSGEVILKL